MDHVNKKIHLSDWLTPYCKFELNSLYNFDEETKKQNKYRTYLSYIYKYSDYELCAHCLAPNKIIDDDDCVIKFLSLK